MGNIFAVFPDWLMLIAVSMVPVIELRGAIPIGVLSYGMDYRLVYILCVIGNLLPVPFIIWFMRPLFDFLRKSKFFIKTIEWLERRTKRKADRVLKYSSIALFLFVAIPLPGTGAWTGSMIAAFLDMRLKHAFPAIAIGVLTAGVLVLGFSHLFV